MKFDLHLSVYSFYSGTGTAYQTGDSCSPKVDGTVSSVDIENFDGIELALDPMGMNQNQRMRKKND
jgi:hypothetical protein